MNRKTTVSTVPQYITEVLRIASAFARKEVSDGPWFRGVNDQRYGLVPGCYWREDIDEEALVVDFKSLAPSYFEGATSYRAQPENAWEWYFLMQHYGLPTRLLDWTESALVGLFFALWPAGERPCVWILDPARLNETTVRDPYIISPGGDFSRHWLPIETDDQKSGCRMHKATTFKYRKARYTNAKPIAIFAARRNARILAQQGTFTVHGASPAPLERLLAGRGSPLACISIDADASASLLHELELCGISELRLFPELDKVAPLVKRRLGVSP